jgi:hypothetical protein
MEKIDEDISSILDCEEKGLRRYSMNNKLSVKSFKNRNSSERESIHKKCVFKEATNKPEKKTSK